MKHKLPKIFTLGAIQGEDWLRLKMEHLARHVCIWGSTGSGKTMVALSLMRQLVSQGIGFTFITPHPDGREKLLHWCDLNKIGPERIVDCTPTTECCVSLDPFANMPAGLNRLQEETWLQSECKRVMAAMMSNVALADQEVMNQLNTWLMNSLYLCGKRVDGEYLGLHKALMLFDIDHPEHDRAMECLLPVVPDFIRADWNVYRGTNNVNQRRAMVQSTINRFRRTIFANPLVTGMFARRANVVSDEDIIRRGMIHVVSVPESDDLPREAGQTVARMRLSSMLGSSKRVGARTPEHLRPYHFFIIDEFENYISEDARLAFQESRKFHTPFVVMMQGTSCAEKGEMNLLDKVTNECGIQATGQQQDPETLDYLADAFSAPFLDHTPLMALQALPVGHESIQTRSVSFTSSQGMSVGEAHAMTQTHSVTKQTHTGRSVQQSVSMALSSSHAEGTSQGRSVGGSAGVSNANNWSEGTGTSRQVSDSQSQGHSRQRSRTSSVGETESESDGVSTQEARNFSTTQSRQLTTSESNGTTQSTSRGESESESESRGRSGPMLSLHHNVNRNSGSSSGKTSNESSGSTSSTTSGISEGESTSEGGSVSQGQTHSRSRGTTRTSGVTEGEGENYSTGRAVSHGEKTQQSVGGSQTASRQQNWSQNHGRSTTDTNGVTRSTGSSLGHSSGESSGESNGRSTGRTDTLTNSQSSGVSVSFNQVPLPLTQIIEHPTGSLVVSVADQVSRFKTCIASLPDRVMLVKVRGMDRPFLLKTHFVADPYDQKKLFVCDAWRAVKLKQYVAKIRKAHPWYFLPSLEEEKSVPAPAPKPRDRRRNPVPAELDPMG